MWFAWLDCSLAGVGIIYSFARYLACWWWDVALVGLWVGALGVLGFLYGGGCFG